MSSEDGYQVEPTAYKNRGDTINPPKSAEDYVSDLNDSQIEGQVIHEMVVDDFRRFLSRFGVKEGDLPGAVDVGMRKVKRLAPSKKGNRVLGLFQSFLTEERNKKPEMDAGGGSDI